MRIKMIPVFIIVMLSCGMVLAQSVVLGVAPNAGTPGQTISVEIKGLGFPATISPAMVNFGEGVTVTSVQMLPSQTMEINGETITVNSIRTGISISSQAVAGTRRVSIATVGSYSSVVFHVVAGDGGGGGGGGSTGVLFPSKQYATRADSPEGLLALDATRDGLADLIVAPDGDASLSLFRATSSGVLAPVRKIPGNIFGSAMIAAGDLNGDGRPDLVTSSRSSTSVGVWIASGTSFRRPLQVAIPAPAWAVGAGDFNGDGAQDIVAVVRDSNQVAMLAGNGNGSFQAPILRAVGDTPKSVTVADLNKDGLADVVVGNYVATISILMGNRTTGLSQQRRKNALLNMENLISGDFNGDGNIDVATIGDDSIVVLRGKGNGDFFAPPKRLRVAKFVWDLAAADFNSDGITDFAFVNYAADQVSIMMGKGNLLFDSPFSFPTQDLPTRIISADFNNDGRPDLALSNYGSDTIGLYLNEVHQ